MQNGASIYRGILTAAIIMLMALSGGCWKQTVLCIDSCHDGYGPSDNVVAGVRETLRSSDLHLRVFFMDTIRYSDPNFINQSVGRALAEIEQFQPAVIIASGDNAVKYIIAPHFKKGPIPCVFCDVHHSCSRYGLPTKNVTGILSVPPLEESLKIIKRHYPDSRKLVIISRDSASEQADRLVLDSECAKLGLLATHALVGTFDQWKKRFVEANKSADIIYVTAAQAVSDWDDKDAREFVPEHIKVPVFTCDASMTPYAVLGLAADLKEQGQWAAKTTLKILNWKRPKDFPVAKGTGTQAYLNEPLANKIGFKPNQALLQRCKLVSQMDQVPGDSQ